MKKIQTLKKADRDLNIKAVHEVLSRAVANMNKPTMIHVIAEVNFDELPSKIIQKTKEVFSSEFKKYEHERHARHNQMQCLLDEQDKTRLRNRKQPDMEIIYSIESKMIKGYKYDHIHFMFIVDFGVNYFGYREVFTMLNNTFNRLPFVVPIPKIDDFNYQGFNGINACGFVRYRDKNTKIKADSADFSEVRGHNLKTEFDDAMIRASYLCKSEQKELLPDDVKRYSFGHTRSSRINLSKAINDEFNYQKIA